MNANDRLQIILRYAPLCGVTGALLLAGPARAQNAASASADSGGAVLQQIVVTADRQSWSADYVQAGSFRGARQLDTPLTISVIPQEVLEAQQDRNLLSALQNTAGITSAETSPTVYDNLSIRGIPVDNRGNYLLDGVLPIINLIDLPLEDKARVEALKGASGLYYGFTSPSGVINLVMKRPSHAPFVETDAFGDDNGGVGAHVDANDWWGIFGARVNAVYAKVDSGIDNTQGHRALLAGAFDIRPSNQLLIQLDLEHIEKTVPEPTVFDLVAPKSTATDLYPRIKVPPLLDPRTNLGSPWMENQAHEDNALVHVNYNLNSAWALTFDTGTSNAMRTRRFSTFTPTNLATGAGTLATTLQNADEYANYMGRVELAGAFDTGPIEHTLLVGAEKNVRRQFNPVSTHGDCPGPTPGSAPITCLQNLFDLAPLADAGGHLRPIAADVRAFLGCRPGACARLARLASPITYVSARTPPMMLIDGTADTEVPDEQTRMMVAALRKAHVPVEVRYIEGANHGLIAHSPAATRVASLAALRHTIRFIGTVSGR